MAESDINLNFSASGAQETKTGAQGVADSLGGVASGAKSANAEISGLLASIGKVRESLAKSGAPEVRKVDASLRRLAEALSSGRLGHDALAGIGKAVADLLVQTDRMPPKGLVELGASLADIAARSAEAARGMATAAGEGFSIGGGGLAALDSVQRKLKAISDATDLGDGIKALEADMRKLGAGEAKRLEGRIREIRAALSGNLDSGSVKRLRNEAKRLAEVMDALGESSFQSIGASGKDVIDGLGRLGDSLDTAGQNAQALSDVYDEVFDRMGIQVGALDRNVVRLTSHIPGIGKALSALKAALSGPIGWILAAIGLIGGAVMKLMRFATDARERVANIRIDNIASTIRTLNEETERHIRLLDLAKERRQAEKRLAEEQLEAEKSLTMMQAERLRMTETRAGMTEEDRFDAEERFGKRQDEAEMKAERESLRRDREANEAEIRDIDERIREYESAAAGFSETRTAARARQSRLNAKVNGMWGRSVWDVDGERERAMRESERLGEEAEKAAEGFKSAMEQIERLRNERKAAIDSREGFRRREGALDGRETLNADRRRRAREEEDLRRALAARQRERELALRARGETDREEDRVRGRDEWRRTEWERVTDASKRLARFGEEADRARRSMKELERKYKGKASMSDVDRQRYDALREDYERARERGLAAQDELDDAARQRQETAWGDADRHRQWMLDDEEFRRQGRYDLAGWDGKVAMDRARMEEGRALRIDAERRLGNRAALSPREIALLEAQRERGRSMETESRGSLRQLLREGDRERAEFEARMRGAGGNRLTQMGLGGNGEDFARSTARNTGKLVALTREMLTRFAGGAAYPVAGRLGETRWSMR